MMMTVVFQGILDCAWPQINANAHISLRGRQIKGRQTQSEREDRGRCTVIHGSSS